MERICRLCLGASLNGDCLSLLEPEAAKMLEALTFIKIDSQDVSTSMCCECQINLKSAYQIQQKILQSEREFQEKINEIHTEIVIKEEILSGPVGPIKTEIISESDDCEVLKIKNADIQIFKKVTCEVCKKIILRANIEKHKKLHEPQTCSFCQLSVPSRNTLNRHVRRYHGETFYCSFCGEVFRYRFKMKQHENRIHTGEAAFVCETCGKKFFNMKNFKRHRDMTHLGLRPFICEFCSTGFSSKFAMVTHRRKHTNETPYKCEVCGKGYAVKVSLKCHLRNAHNIVEKNIVKCGNCSREFASQVALSTHSRLHL